MSQIPMFFPFILLTTRLRLLVGIVVLVGQTLLSSYQVTQCLSVLRQFPVPMVVAPEVVPLSYVFLVNLLRSKFRLEGPYFGLLWFVSPFPALPVCI